MRRIPFAAGLALVALPSLAQLPVTPPGPSPHASVTETVAVTEIAVTYSRPAVKGRKIWGGLVPYGQVWRAGANENTVVAFSTAVKVEGQPLPAGRYGLHAIPTEGSWTVIFSKESRAWGSYSYDQKEDALRVTVTPQAGENVERLLYTFDDVTDASATLSLRWERLRVPVKIDVDRVATVTADLSGQLRGLPRFGWQGWNGAAQWLVANGGDLDLATAWIDKSIALQENGANLMTKAALLEKKGDAKAAAELRRKADEVATEAQRNNLGYQYLGAGQVDLAIAAFQKNAKAFPNSWNVWDSLAEAYATKGDKKAAIENYTKALAMTKDDAQKKRIETELAKLR
jgi:hypothetical protein